MGFRIVYIAFFAFSISFAMYDVAIAFRLSVILFLADDDEIYHVDSHAKLLR